MRAMDLGGMLSLGRGWARLLKSVVAANQEGRIDPAGLAMGRRLQRQISTRSTTGCRSRRRRDRRGRRSGPAADPAAGDAAHLLEVADGGSARVSGCCRSARVVKEYGTLRSPGMMPRGREWPAGLLPVVSQDPGLGRHRGGNRARDRVGSRGAARTQQRGAFQASFSDVAPSVEAWLAGWLESPTHDEQRDAMMADLTPPEVAGPARARSRAAIGRMSLEERRAMGLPDEGWEEVVWGGIGWDPDELRPGGLAEAVEDRFEHRVASPLDVAGRDLDRQVRLDREPLVVRVRADLVPRCDAGLEAAVAEAERSGVGERVGAAAHGLAGDPDTCRPASRRAVNSDAPPRTCCGR